MKNTQISPTQSATKNIGSCVAMNTSGEITTNFVAEQIAKTNANTDGQNNYLKDLHAITAGMLSSFVYQSFSFEDFLTFAVHLDLPFETLRQFFNDWTKALQKAGRLEIIQGCYGYPVHRFV